MLLYYKLRSYFTYHIIILSYYRYFSNTISYDLYVKIPILLFLFFV